MCIQGIFSSFGMRLYIFKLGLLTQKSNVKENTMLLGMVYFIILTTVCCTNLTKTFSVKTEKFLDWPENCKKFSRMNHVLCIWTEFTRVPLIIY